jgi:hypothetical protein
VDLKQADMMSLVFYVICQLTNFVMQPKSTEADLHATAELRDAIYEKMQEAAVLPAVDDERFAEEVVKLMREGLRKN